MAAGKRPDPYQGWIRFATVRSGTGAGQCQYTCNCGESQMCATRSIATELARAHVAQHGVVIEVSTGPTAKRVPGTMSSARPLEQVEESRAWFTGGAQAVADLRARRRATAGSGNPLASHLTGRRR